MSADASATRSRFLRRLEHMVAMWGLPWSIRPDPARGGREVLSVGERRGHVVFGGGWVWFGREGKDKGTHYGVPQHRAADANVRALARELVDPEGIAREDAERARQRAEERARWDAAAEARRLIRKAEHDAQEARVAAEKARRTEAHEAMVSTLRLLGVEHDVRVHAEPYGPGGVELTFRNLPDGDARTLVLLAIERGILRPILPRERT